MSISKCDIIRDSVNALCVGKDMPVACEASNMSNVKMARFNAMYDPISLVETGIAKMIRNRKIEIYDNQIAESRIKLANAYNAPDDATDINWQDHTLCLWDPSGAPGGMLGNEKYITRLDLINQMSPKYIVGGQTLANQFWKYGMSPMPINVDYAMNPDLAMFMIIMFILLVFIGLTLKVYTKKSSISQNAAPFS